MLKLLPAAIFLLFLGSCGPPKSETTDSISAPADSVDNVTTGFHEGDYESYSRLENYAPEDTTRVAQTVTTTCAILIDPTEEQFTKMEKEYGEDLATIADDASFYRSQAVVTLDSLNIPIIEADKDILKLKGRDQVWVLDVRKEGAPAWNVIFFRTDKKPEILSSIDVSRESINQYFNP